MKNNKQKPARLPVNILTVSRAMSTADSRETDGNSFAELSAEAQDLVARAAMGEFENGRRPVISDAVREEIRQWAVSVE